MNHIILIALLAACAVFAVAACTKRTQPDTTLSSQYFARGARFDTKGNQLVVIDPNSPRVITMDEWPQMVFSSADGQHTIQQFHDSLASKYGKDVPPDLNRQISQIVRQLESEKLVRLSPTPITLPHYLSVPFSEQDPQPAKAEMEKDGFIRK